MKRARTLKDWWDELVSIAGGLVMMAPGVVLLLVLADILPIDPWGYIGVVGALVHWAVTRMTK